MEGAGFLRGIGVKAKTKLNVELLRKIKKHILAVPRRFAMNHFIIRGEPGRLLQNPHQGSGGETYPASLDGAFRKAPACGTVGCIAGWAAFFTAKNPARINNDNAQKRAAKALGISAEQGKTLFFTENWPDGGEGYHFVKTAREKAKLAAERIEEFIQENKG